MALLAEAIIPDCNCRRSLARHTTNSESHEKLYSASRCVRNIWSAAGRLARQRRSSAKFRIATRSYTRIRSDRRCSGTLRATRRDVHGTHFEGTANSSLCPSNCSKRRRRRFSRLQSKLDCHFVNCCRFPVVKSRSPWSRLRADCRRPFC